MVKRGDIWLAALDPTVGSEIQKTRPCVVVSPPEINDHLRTVVVAPMTTGSRTAPYRVPISFAGKRGLILLEQVRSVDKRRLVKHVGKAPIRVVTEALRILRELFSE